MSSDSEGCHVEKKQSREERLRNVQSLCASIQSEQRKRTVAEGGITMATAAKKGKGQRSTYNIKLGWQDFREGKYRVVTKAKGGESRMMHYTFGETLTVERIRNQALVYFFPDGVSNMASVEEYDFSLALTSGKVIDSFIDKNKNPCNFSEYLRANGLYASQCHIYLRSKKKENKSFVINGVPIEKGDRTINIKYSKIKQSRYSEEQSELSCQSTLRCFDVSGSPEKDTYDPFEDGFLVSRIEVQNTVFLERDGNVYNCPEASSPEQFILNGPNQIFGLEVDDSNSLVLGAITIAHNNNYIYKWLRNGNLFCSGINRCVVKVTEPGSYHVTVVNSDDSSTQGMSDIVKVDVIPSAKTCIMNKGALLQTIHPAAHSQIINPVVDPQIESPALHSQVINPVVDPQIAHVATHSQVTNPVVDPQIAHVATHSQVINPVVDPQIAHVATHSQVTNPVVDPQIAYVATHSQVTNPVVDPQIAHVATHSQVTNPVVDPQIAHVAKHSQVINPVVDPQIAHVATHSQVTNPVVDPQIAHVATHSQIIKSAIDPQFDHASKQSQIISSVVDPQIEHSAQLQVVGKPAERLTDSNFCNSTSNLNCVPLIQLTDIAFGRELGKGGFGTVFEGEWLKSKVAVKVISVKRLKLIKYNLLREITLHSQLRHPNIVLLMAYALESSKLYLITELVEGESLDEVLFGDKNKTLIMSERLAIAEKICLAVVYLHSQTQVVIHRDIKPENILISYDLKQVK